MQAITDPATIWYRQATFLKYEKIVLISLIFCPRERLFAKKSGKNKPRIFHFVVAADFEERSCPSSSWAGEASYRSIVDLYFSIKDTY